MEIGKQKKNLYMSRINHGDKKTNCKKNCWKGKEDDERKCSCKEEQEMKTNV